MNTRECTTCRFTCKMFLEDCDFYLPERRQSKRKENEILMHFWANISACMTP